MLRAQACSAGHKGQRKWGRAPWAVWASMVLALLLSGAAGLAAAQAVRDPAADAAQLQREQLDQWRRQINQRAQVLTAPAEQRWAEPVAGERPCFVIERFTLLEGAALQADFGWLLDDLRGFRGACLGLASIEALRGNLQARLAAAGYITSSLSVPAQDLASGQLAFGLQLGRIDEIHFVTIDPSGQATALPGPARSALAVRAGMVLNLRQIEQSLENLARLPSMAAQFRIEPGRLPDTSRLLILLPGGRPWQASLGLDTTDSKDLGPLQLSARWSLDSPLGLADQFSAVASVSSRNGDGHRPGQASLLLNHSLPLGQHLLWANLSHSRFQRQVLGGVSRFEERGEDSQAQLRWQTMLWRNQSSRLALWAGATARLARTWLEDTELLLRRRSSSSVDLGLSFWRRDGCGQWSAELDVARTVRLKRELLFQPEPVALPQAWRAQVQWACEWPAASSAGGAPSGKPGWAWEGRLLLQGVNHPFGSTDLVSIGSRWTVRGHAGQHAVSGEGLQLLRQELHTPAWPLSAAGAVRAFAALDHGRVSRPLSAPGQPHALSAAALGLRWQLWGSSGELVAARPLRRLQPAQGTVVFGSVNQSF